MTTASRALLTRLIDYAGLFPPAGLDMAASVRNFAAYRAGEQAWMLGRLVAPASRLDELEEATAGLLPGHGEEPWPLTVVLEPDVRAGIERVRQLQDRFSGTGLRVASIESAVEGPEEVAARLSVVPEGIELFVEIPVAGEPGPFLRGLAGSGARAKIRTGGITESAFPTPGEVARFLLACNGEGVAFKATAGLHHPVCGRYPLTYEQDSPRGRMFGFLNLFLAGGLVRTGRLDEAGCRELLVETDPAAFVFDDTTAAWRTRSLSAAEIERARSEFALSYGSCSFTEPVEDLKGLHLP